MNKNSSFSLNPNASNLVIHFNRSISTLVNYFCVDYDSLAINIDLVDFSNFDSSQIENLGSLFFGVTKLKYVNFKNFNSSKLSSLSGMFAYFPALSSIDLSYLDTSNVNEYSGVFYGCTNLRLIDIEGFNFNKDEIVMSDMFNGVNSLHYINIRKV